jgi:multisubunit Na+/H+ antiporter MnhE subunit
VKFLGLNLIIASIWLLLQDSPTFATFVIGGGLGFGLIFLFRDVLDSRDYTRRVVALFSFVLIFFWQFLVAARDLLRIVLATSMKKLTPRMITYDVSDLKTYETLILCHLITLTPGSSVVALSADHSTLVLHVLNTTNPDAVRDEIDQTLKRGLLAITR